MTKLLTYLNQKAKLSGISDGLFLCLIFLGTFIFLAPLSFGLETLKWDALDLNAPWRAFVNLSLSNGDFPLWNPFHYPGWPAHIDNQHWYWPTWLIGLIVDNPILQLNAEYVLHIAIATIGCYYLLDIWRGNKWARLVFAFTFSLNGFFLGNSQHLGWIFAASWIPFVFNFLIRYYRNQSQHHLIGLCISYACLFTSGYFAFAITLFYIIALVLSILFIGNIRNRPRTTGMQYGGILLLIVLLCSPVFLSYISSSEILGRAQKLDSSSIAQGSLTLKHLISIIWPAVTLEGNYDFWQLDQSMMNLYCGLLTIIFVCYSILHNTTKTDIVLLVLAFLSLGLCFANDLPLRRWLSVLPLMDLYRLPALFRIFFLLGMTCLGFRGFIKFLDSGKSLLGLGLGFLLLLVGVFLIRNQFLSFDISTRATSQLLITALLVLGMIILHILHKSNWILGLILLDVLLAFYWNAPVSLFGENSPKEYVGCYQNLPKSYKQPDLAKSIGVLPSNAVQNGPIYRNNGNYHQHFLAASYNPYQFHHILDKENKFIYKDYAAHPLLFFSRVDDQNNVKRIPTEQLEAQVELLEYRPNYLKCLVKNGKDLQLVLNQMYHKDWLCKVDGHFRKLSSFDGMLIGLPIWKEQNIVEFQYKPQRYGYAFVAGIVTLIILLIYIGKINLFVIALLAMVLSALILRVRGTSLPATDCKTELTEPMLPPNGISFEKKATSNNWKNGDRVYSGWAHSGRHFQSFENGEPYGLTYEKVISSSGKGTLEIDAAVSLWSQKDGEAKLVSMLQQTDTNDPQQFADVTIPLEQTTWQPGKLKHTWNINSSGTYLLKIYVWNANGLPMRLDDFSVNLKSSGNIQIDSQLVQ